MRYLKILGLLAVAAAAMMVVASSASATTLTKGEGVAVGVGEIITAETEEDVEHSKGNKHAILTGPVGIEVTCNGHAEIVVTDAGTLTSTVKGDLRKVTFTSCTNGVEVDVVLFKNAKGEEIAGTGELHTQGETSNGNGTLTASGATVTITKIPGVGTCSYRSGENLDVGTVTGAPSATEHATLDITRAVPRHAGSAFCGAEGTWEGKYKVTSPTGLKVH